MSYRLTILESMFRKLLTLCNSYIQKIERKIIKPNFAVKLKIFVLGLFVWSSRWKGTSRDITPGTGCGDGLQKGSRLLHRNLKNTCYVPLSIG